MKRILFALAILALLVPTASRARGETEVSVDFFYNNLGDDGSWIEVGDYGYCWQPSVAVSNAKWRPYSDGYWAYTDVGWTWVSNEDFGWATYHYGRWAHLQDQGWVWVPGHEWGPAWVSWRTGGDYVGWAPLPPQSASSGGEVVYEGRPITGQVDIDFDIGPSYYNFVDVRYIGEPVLRDRIFEPSQNVNYINRTVNVTNITYTNSTVYNYGPDYNRLSAYSTRPIRRMHLERQTNVDFNTASRSGGPTRVQGDKIVIAAPLRVDRGSRTAAPKVVKTKIAKANLETGWGGISDPKAKAELQQKFRTEDRKSVPPPQVPATNPAALTAASPGVSPAASAIPGATSSPAGGTTPPVATPTPAGSVTPAPAATTPTPQAGRDASKLAQTPSPAASANASPVVSPNESHGRKAGRGPLPAPSASVQPSASPAGRGDQRGKGRDKSERTPNEQLIKPSATPATSVAPEMATTPAGAVEEGRGKGKQGRQPISTVAPTAPPSGSTGNVDAANGNPKPARKVVTPNPPDGSGLRTTNRPDGVPGPGAGQQSNDAQSNERPTRKAPVNPSQQLTPPQGAQGNGPGAAAREGQPKGDKGKKEKKNPEASPAPEQ